MSFFTKENRTDGLTDWPTDWLTDGSKTLYPPQLVPWGIINTVQARIQIKNIRKGEEGRSWDEKKRVIEKKNKEIDFTLLRFNKWKYLPQLILTIKLEHTYTPLLDLPMDNMYNWWLCTIHVSKRFWLRSKFYIYSTLANMYMCFQTRRRCNQWNWLF